jgi:hypothetical protein
MYPLFCFSLILATRHQSISVKPVVIKSLFNVISHHENETEGVVGKRGEGKVTPLRSGAMSGKRKNYEMKIPKKENKKEIRLTFWPGGSAGSATTLSRVRFFRIVRKMGTLM